MTPGTDRPLSALRPPRWAAIATLILALAGGHVAQAEHPFAAAPAAGSGPTARAARRLFARDNLVAWCIVPFDSRKRGPEERAAMLERLGFLRFAYDWRGEHVATFDTELDALERHGIRLQGFWLAPGELNETSKKILDLLRRHGVKTQLWVLIEEGPKGASGEEQHRKVEDAAGKLRPLAEAAEKVGCSLALYNHGGWFGEPENQIAIIERLKTQGVENVGIVYNLHHGHDHLDRFAALLKKTMPYLRAVNLNGMIADGERTGRKILPLGQGPLDLGLLRTLCESGYDGPIGILGHTMDDAEDRLRDNLDGLDWLVPQLEGKAAGPRPKPRTYTPPAEAGGGKPADKAAVEAERVKALLASARTAGDPRKGAEVFSDLKFACITCHKVGTLGGEVGPDLSTVGRCLTPEQVVEAVLWPAKRIAPGYEALAVSTTDGRVIQGLRVSESGQRLVLKDAATGRRIELTKAEVEETREIGTLMPEGVSAALSPDQLRDLVRFLLDLGRSETAGEAVLAHAAHVPAEFPYDRHPLRPDEWAQRGHPVNRDRLYDFYEKEAAYFLTRPVVPPLLPAYPGLDGGAQGHWGNQNEDVWADDRWNRTDLGTLLSGGFRAPGVTVPKGVCVRLGDEGEVSACFNPETLCYEAAWSGGFVRTSRVRHGFMDGLAMSGTPLPRPEGTKPAAPFVYHGFYRAGKRVVFSYRLGETEMLDVPWAEEGRFTRIVAPADGHPLADLTRGGPPQWPQVIATKGEPGKSRPYAIDTIALPFDNPWRALLFVGDHDFLPDGSAVLCTIQGDVWRVEGLDERLDRVRWRRIASGLHQPLGLVVADGLPCVLGRDQITRLHDLNGDGETDFYECVSNAYATSAAGHDFICGLQRDRAGSFYTVSGRQGLIRIPPDGKPVEVLATGFRNADGLGLTPDGVLTVPNSEGEWVPASMVCEVRPGGYYGYGGPRDGRPPDLPLVYLPRGLDNSSGGQAYVSSDRWGPLQGQMIHLSYGAGAHFLLLRDRVDGQPQGTVVPLPGDFRSGVHRGRFSPKDGQLYVSGMAGWGTYTPDDGCFQRVRYTGDPVQLPIAVHAHENGVFVAFSRPVDRAVAGVARNHFAQCWNYRYGAAYGSPELSPRHPGAIGHDPLEIRSAAVLDDGRSLFLEIPEIQPVNQLHLHLSVEPQTSRDLFLTVHKLAGPFTGFPGYRPAPKTIAAHPILADLAKSAPSVPNPWRKPLPDARPVTIEAGKNLTFAVTTLDARAGEPIKLTFNNPDVVPHNWALIRPGTLPRVGALANALIAEPDAFARHYIPRTDDVLAYTDIVEPGGRFTISFRAPDRPGRYPFLCTFPGHWMAMNGVLIVR